MAAGAVGAAGFLAPTGRTGVVMGFRMTGLVLVLLLLLLLGCVTTWTTAGLDAVLASDDDGPRGIRVRVAGLGPVVAAGAAAAGLFFGVVWSSLLGVLGAGCGAAATLPVEPVPNFFLAEGGTIREGDLRVLLTIGSELALVVG